jgi:hypothetical protein
MRPLSFCIFPVAVVLAAACNSNNGTSQPACGPDNAATTTADWVYATNVEAGLYFAAVDPVGSGFFTFASIEAVSTPQASMAATAVAQAAGTNFPNGCATATANQNAVTFNLNNCSGPLGITNLTGTVTATLNATGNGQLLTQLTGTNVTTNGATLDLNTSGVATVDANGQKTLNATSMSTGTGPNGNSIAHAGSYTVVWPTSPGCATINAAFVGGLASALEAGALDASSLAEASGVTTTTVTDYVACNNMCPQSGTSTTNLDGQAVTLTFNGSTTAECTSTTGQSAGLSIKCP